MTRRNSSFFDDLIAWSSKLPGWAGVVLAGVAFFLLHAAASTQDIPVDGAPLQTGPFTPQNLAFFGQYLLPSVFLLGAALSVYGRSRRGNVPKQTTTHPDSGALHAMTWRQFERLVGEAFRRKGYTVKTSASGGDDDGFDLVLKKAGQRFLVQCKQWRAHRVGVNTVNELAVVVAAEGAAGGVVVSTGVFTEEARTVAKGQRIQLMDGTALHELIDGVALPPQITLDPLNVMTTGAPFCPVCQGRMVMRKARGGPHAGKEYWRCLRHPECTGKRRI